MAALAPAPASAMEVPAEETAQIRTAIRLKTAIDRAPKVLTPIGTIVNSLGRLADWKESREEDEDEDDHDGEEMKKESTKSKRARSDKNEFSGSKRYKKVTETVVKQLYDLCHNSSRSVLVSADLPYSSSFPSTLYTSYKYKGKDTLCINFPLSETIQLDSVVAPTPPSSFRKSKTNPIAKRDSDGADSDSNDSNTDGNEETKENKGDKKDSTASEEESESDEEEQDEQDPEDSLKNKTAIYYDGRIAEVPKSIIERLWQHGAVSGFGDVASQTTKVDLDVRNARELTTEHFTVHPDLCDELARVWSGTLFPKRVKVVPCKLNIYGPGGKFDKHRDTPQAGLVGTALVGLGDSTDKAAGLSLADGKHLWRAGKGEYVLFYPDVVHEVLPITSGYRATIAFKVMHDPSMVNAAELESIDKTFQKRQLRMETRHANEINDVNRSYNSHYESFSEKRERDDRIKILSSFQATELESLHKERETARQSAIDEEERVRRSEAEVGNVPTGFEANRQVVVDLLRKELSSLDTPFGLLLNHEYTLNSGDTLVGADAVMFEVLSSIPEFKITIFPVLTQYSDCDGCDGDAPTQDTSVYPLTDKHVEYVLSAKEKPSKYKSTKRKKIKDASQDVASDSATIVEPNTPGFNGIASGIRFISSGKLESSGFEWAKQETEGAELCGNESRAADEDSLYIHKALVITRSS